MLTPSMASKPTPLELQLRGSRCSAFLGQWAFLTLRPHLIPTTVSSPTWYHGGCRSPAGPSVRAGPCQDDDDEGWKNDGEKNSHRGDAMVKAQHQRAADNVLTSARALCS